MATYTTELKNIVQIQNGEIVTVFDGFLKDYPLFDEAYRDTLNTKIIKHYYFHEIGFETPERFVFEVNRKMGEVMTLFNQLYKSEIAINPLINFKKVSSVTATSDTKTKANDTYTQNETEKRQDFENEVLETKGTRNDAINDNTTNTKTQEQESTSKQDTDNTNTNNLNGKVKDAKSDTPTSQLLAGDISGNLYATEVVINETSNSTQQNTTQEVNETQNTTTSETDTSQQIQTTVSELASDTEKVNTKNGEVERVSNDVKLTDGEETNTRTEYINEEGSTMSESEMLLKYRETFLNIDMQVIEALSPMFMLIM